jgi:VWFA-related protein
LFEAVVFESSPIRKWIYLCALALSSHSFSQDAGSSLPSDIPALATKFKTRAELVTVPVVVTYKNGLHVLGLKKEDFTLLEDGKPQKIANLEEVEKTSGPAKAPAAQPGQFSNLQVEDNRPKQLTLIVLDKLNTPIEYQSFAQQQMLKYLNDSVNTHQLTSLFVITRDGMRVVYDFTDDPQLLVPALAKVKVETNLVDEASEEAIPKASGNSLDSQIAKMAEKQHEADQRLESQERTTSIDTTLRSMQQIAQYCAGIPGRKAMLWASAGFPFSVNEADLSINIAGVKGASLSDFSEKYRKTWRALEQAQVSVYPVDVRGLLDPTMPDISIRSPRDDAYGHDVWKQVETIGTFQEFARATGGRAFFNGNDLAGAFLKASEDNAAYYVLSYYLDRAAKKSGWHKLAVKVRRGGVQVRARSGFFLDQNTAKHAEYTELQLALDSPLNSTAIAVTGKWQQAVSAADGKQRVVFLLTMPANFAQIDADDNNHVILEFAAIARTEDGSRAGETSKTMDGHLEPETAAQIRNHGMDYRGALTLPPGNYTVHFAVEDRLSGRIGSVSAPLKVAP